MTGHLTVPRSHYASQLKGRPPHHIRRTKISLQSSSSLASAVFSSSSPPSLFLCHLRGAGPRGGDPRTSRVQCQALAPHRRPKVVVRSPTAPSPSMHPSRSSNQNQIPAAQSTHVLDPPLRSHTPSLHQGHHAPSTPTPYAFHDGLPRRSSHPRHVPPPPIWNPVYRGPFSPRPNLPFGMPAHASPTFQWIHSQRIRSRMAHHSASLPQPRRARIHTHPHPRAGYTSQKH